MRIGSRDSRRCRTCVLDFLSDGPDDDRVFAELKFRATVPRYGSALHPSTAGFHHISGREASYDVRHTTIPLGVPRGGDRSHVVCAGASQASTASSLSGTVVDSSGGVIPGADVVA